MLRIACNLWRDVTNPIAGGAERYEFEVLDRLAQRGHDVVSIVAQPAHASGHYRVIGNGGTYSQYLKAPLTRARHLGEVDVMIDGVNGMPFFTPLMTRTPTLALVHHVHVQQWRDYFSAPVARVGRFLESWGTPRAYRNSLIAAVSESTASDLVDLGLSRDQIRVITAGSADTTTAAPPKSAEPLFIALGRLVPNKRLHVLLDMWAKVHPVVGGRLAIVGRGPELAGLQDRNVAGVEFPGYVTDAERDRLLDQAWLLVHAAMHEGWGLVTTEAAGHHTPTLAFDVPGIRDAVHHGRTGILATSEADYISQWISLAGEPSRRGSLGACASARAGSRSWDDVADDFEDTLHLLVSEASRVRPTPRPMSSDDRIARPFSSTERSIVIPAFNEERRLPHVLNALPNALDPATTEVIVVDDGSTDRTAAVAEAARADLPRLQVLRLAHNRGKGAAIRAGVGASRGAVIGFIDADNAADLSVFETMERRLADHGAVFGSRSLDESRVVGAPRHRKLMGATFHRLAAQVTGSPVVDTQCGYKLFRAANAKLAFRLSHMAGFAFDVEILRLLTKMNIDVAEHPIEWTHQAGSKIAPLDPVRMAVDLARIARQHPQGMVPVIAIDAEVPSDEIGVRVGDPVLAAPGSTKVLLPFVDDAGQQAVASRLQRRWPSATAGFIAAKTLLAEISSASQQLVAR